MLSKGLSGNATSDAGILIERGSSGDNAFMGLDHSSSNFVMGTTTANGTATSIDSGFNKGTLNANLIGDVNVTVGGTTPASGNFTTVDSGTVTTTGLITGVGLTTTGSITATGQTIASAAITSTGLITGVGLTTTGAITATGQTIASGAITSTGNSSMEKLTVDSIVSVSYTHLTLPTILLV